MEIRWRHGLWNFLHAAWLPLLGLIACAPLAASQTSSGFALVSVQHRPTWGPQKDKKTGHLLPLPPSNVVQKYLEDTGYNPLYDTRVNFSKRTYVGCFAADFAITEHQFEGANQDPNECYEKCQKKWENSSSYDILVAIHGERCGCVLKDITTFNQVDDRRCTMYCKYYQNPICGGKPNYWGLYIEYDFQSLTAHGAFDPWRNTFYTVVAVSDRRIRGGFVTPEGLLPERYFLHAVDVYDGKAQYQYQMKLDGLLYGLQYDIDTTRLVALHTKTDVGRLRNDMDWTYKLATIAINTTFKTKPQLELSLTPIKILEHEVNSSHYLAISGASTILSVRNVDCFIFTQTRFAPNKKDMKDKMYFVRIPDGYIMNKATVGYLDFKVLQIFANEKYGDVTAIGPRQGFQEEKSSQSYMYIARLYHDAVADKVVVDWRFNEQVPDILVDDPKKIAELEIYPGLSASNHLFNKSAITFAYVPWTIEKEERKDWPDKRAITIMEVNIRSKSTQMWCNQSNCIGSIDSVIPYAGLYNKEPGIPLSLKSPKMTLARFSMEAGTIFIDFNRATLQGALQIDTNNDFVPDEIDKSKAPVGRFDCGRMFDAASVLLLGPYGSNGTECMWMTDSRVQINLPPIINISVGDSLFLKPDTIYALPADGEYSPASGGGVQVDPPDPLKDPVVILTGATSIDECSPVKLVARDSFNVGGLPKYNWTFVRGTEDAPNPNDLTNSPFRKFSTKKIAGLREALFNATRDNTEELLMASDLLEPAASYRFELFVTSRWKRTSKKEVLLTKLSFAAPMVSILGPAVLETTRPKRISLEANGRPSLCAGADSKLGYRWTMSAPANAPTDIFAADPTITTTAKALVLPPFSLEPPKQPTDPPILANLYNFTVGCYVDSPIGDTPEKTAYATVTVSVTASKIFIVFRTESRIMTRGDILVLDARQSQDPDYPTGSEHTFKGEFAWRCLDPNRDPCYPTPYGMVRDGTLYQVQACRKDIGRKIQDGGTSFMLPLFDSSSYCQYTRGVMMFQTSNFTQGQYKFKLKIFSFAKDRSAEDDVTIDIVNQRVPKVFLQVRDRKERYPITREIRIFGTEEGGKANSTKTFSWEIMRRLLRWDPSVAKEASNDPNNPYLADKYKFERDVSLDPTDAAKFQADPSVPTLKVRPGVLQADNTYRFRLTMTLSSGAQGYSDLTITTAGLPPRSGRLKIKPMDATQDTARVFQAIDWTADNIPLKYSWGYMKTVGSGTTKMPLSTDPLLVSVMDVNMLPQGSAGTNYSLIIYCDIVTPFDVVTTEKISVKSRPPKNATTAVANMLGAADNADPASVLGVLDAALSTNPKDPKVQDQVLNMITAKSGEIPVTPSQLTNQAGLLADMISNGKTDDSVLNVVEGLIISAADSGNFAANPADPGGSIADLAMSALGGLMPGAVNTGAQPGGGRRLMTKYRNVNDDFTAREPDVMPRNGYLTDADDTLISFQADLGRQVSNHPEPALQSEDDDISDEDGDGNDEWGLPLKTINRWSVTECPTPYCDKVTLICVMSDFSGTDSLHVCCDERNPETLCNDPPCWFPGQDCPATREIAMSLPPGDGADGLSAPPHGWRRLQMPSDEKMGEAGVDTSDNWFDQWNAYNFPLDNTDDRAMSDFDRASAYHGWHPDVYKRKLMYAKADPSKSRAQMLMAMEEDEVKEIATVRAMVSKTAINDSKTMRMDAAQEVAFSSMDPGIANLMKVNAERGRVARINWKMQYDRNNSQRITRLSVQIHTICKLILQQISTGEIKTYNSVSFKLQCGKTTNLSRIHPSFVFPKPFQVPSDSPDYPTPSNPVTGFAFIFIAYAQNIYSWSDSNPESTQSTLLTLIALKASTQDIDIHKNPVTNEPIEDPIRVFTDLTLFSNALCLFWDRFAKNTAGGSWSTQGVTNDGTACITTNLSDVAMFMDGRMPQGSMLVDAATDWERENWESTCIGCGDTKNMFVVAVLGMVIFTDILLILMGYVLDETRRADMQKQKLNSRYYYDGDGLTGPMNVDDAIAYHYSEKLVLLWLGTLVKVMEREHALLSPAFYHETFTRPQRLLCFGAMSLGILSMNAIVQSRRGFLLSPDSYQEYVMAGVLSGLLTFPIYCGLVLMFSMRPMPVKKRLIKRTYNPREIDLIAQKRRELDHTSNLMPPPGYLQLPPPPPGGIPHPPGGTALLGMAPAKLLPKLPPQAPGGENSMPALPPPPPPGFAGLPGIPALPALPGGGMQALPPPPRYPPPPKGAKAPPVQMLLPPMQFKQGPPQQPQIASYENMHSVPGTMIPNSPYVEQGTLEALENDSMGETGGISAMLPLAMDAGSTGGMSESGDLQAAPPGARRLENNAMFGAAFSAHGSEPELASEGDADIMSQRGPDEPDRGITLTTPRGGKMEISANDRVNTVFVRGQPSLGLAPPFPQGPSGPGGFSAPLPIGMKPPPGMPQTFLPPGLPGMGGMPVPPPPPKEDDQAFVRRIRLTYMDKVIKEHERFDLLEDHDELGKDTPGWVFSTMTLMPYLAACTFSCCSIFIVLAYGTKFLDPQAQRWVQGSVIGLAMVLVLLEFFRILMMTLVELRKFENRKKAKAGHFLPRRVKREDDKDFQAAPKPRLWKDSVAAPAVPKGHKNPKSSGPSARPAMDLPGVSSGTNVLDGLPPIGNTNLASLGVAGPPPPPPRIRPPQRDFAGSFGQVPGGMEALDRGYDNGPHTPTSVGGLSGTGRLGSTPPTMGMGQSGPPGFPGFPGGTGSPSPGTPGSASLGAQRQQMQQSLSEQVKAGTDRANKPPPPASGPNSRSGSRGTSPRLTPPPPNAAPPGYSRPKSRPTSASSASKAPPAPPPGAGAEMA